MKKLLILASFLLISACVPQDKKFVQLCLWAESPTTEDRGIVGGQIDITEEKKGDKYASEINFYAVPQSCTNEIKKTVKSSRYWGKRNDPSYGVNNEDYIRYICVRYWQVKDLIGADYYIDINKFFERYGDKVQRSIGEPVHENYSLLPLE